MTPPLDAKIFTTNDGMALDSFYIQDMEGKAFDKSEQLKKLNTALERALSGDLKLRSAIAPERPGLPSRARVFKVEPRVLVDNAASNRWTCSCSPTSRHPGASRWWSTCSTCCGISA